MAAKKKAKKPAAKKAVSSAKPNVANVVRAMRAFAAALPPQESAVETARRDVLCACDEFLAEGV